MFIIHTNCLSKGKLESHKVEVFNCSDQDYRFPQRCLVYLKDIDTLQKYQHKRKISCFSEEHQSLLEFQSH
jgi:hypothetical protein